VGAILSQNRFLLSAKGWGRFTSLTHFDPQDTYQGTTFNRAIKRTNKSLHVPQAVAQRQRSDQDESTLTYFSYLQFPELLEFIHFLNRNMQPAGTM
jgi:hypothetical protein